jgi:hypothetical protein
MVSSTFAVTRRCVWPREDRLSGATVTALILREGQLPRADFSARELRAAATPRLLFALAVCASSRAQRSYNVPSLSNF